MGYDPSLSVRDMAELAREAERRGFDMAFFSEALLCNRDSVTALTAFGLGAKATFAASGGDRLARGRRHRNIICQTQTLAAQEPDATAAGDLKPRP